MAAPTGSGKTVVAEHAVARALAEGRKAFYTTPIKALSNQKFHDLVARHGPERGGPADRRQRDQRRRPDRGDDHRGAAQHDLQPLGGARRAAAGWCSTRSTTCRTPTGDRCGRRSSSTCPPRSAWCACRPPCPTRPSWPTGSAPCAGPTATVIETERPIELDNLFMVGDQVEPTSPHLIPTLVDGRPNPEGERFDLTAAGAGPGPTPAAVVHAATHRGGRPARATCDLLPAIYFIFSRAACDDAVHGLPRRRGAPDRARAPGPASDEIVEQHVAGLCRRRPRRCSATAGGWPGSRPGIAAHHAGMVPPFKEAVEPCFAEGLVRAVFATETLALGINMPARTRRDREADQVHRRAPRVPQPGPVHPAHRTGRAPGHRHRPATPWCCGRPFVSFGEVAGLAASRSFVLTSSFRPDLQHGGQPGAALPGRRRPTTCSTCPSPSSRPTRRWSASRPGWPAARPPWPTCAAEATCERGDVEEYRAWSGDEPAGGARRPRRALDDGARAACGPAT